MATAGAPIPASAERDYDSHPVALWLNSHSKIVVAGALCAMTLDGGSSGEAAKSAVDAMLISVAAAEALKAIVDQARPRDAGARDGFPSSHTAASFAFARGVAESDSGLGAAAYMFAGAVGWARVEGGYHTLEQVLGGALLGIVLANISIESGGVVINSGEGSASALLSDRRGTGAETLPGTKSVVLWETQW